MVIHGYCIPLVENYRDDTINVVYLCNSFINGSHTSDIKLSISFGLPRGDAASYADIPRMPLEGICTSPQPRTSCLLFPSLMLLDLCGQVIVSFSGLQSLARTFL